jgi:hypothetical protein
MTETIEHWAAINEFFYLGRKIGYIPIKEFSLLNVTDNDEKRVDLAWLDKEGDVKYLFEFEKTGNRHNFTKIMKHVNAIGEIRGVFVFQFKVYESLQGTKLKLMNTNVIDQTAFLKMVGSKADVEFFEYRGKIAAKRKFDKKETIDETRWGVLKDMIERPITEKELERYYK